MLTAHHARLLMQLCNLTMQLALLSRVSADENIDFITSNGLHLEWIIGTHVHAGHLSGAPYIQGQLGGKIGIGEYIQEVQDTFGKVFNEVTKFQRDGSQSDKLFKDGDLY